MLTPVAERTLPRTAADLLDRDTTALLLWDLQHGLGGRARRLTELHPRWLALRDAAHAAGVLVVRSRHVAVAHDLMADTELWRLARKQGVATAGELAPYMQPGSDDVRFLDGLEPQAGELVLDKTAPSLFVGTAAQSLLGAAGIRTLVLAGVATDIGIDFTARHALALGFFPVVIEDAVGAYGDRAQERGLDSIRSFALTTDTAAVLSAWRHRTPPTQGAR